MICEGIPLVAMAIFWVRPAERLSTTSIVNWTTLEGRHAAVFGDTKRSDLCQRPKLGFIVKLIFSCDDHEIMTPIRPCI
jgi:hypothetical protein